VDNMERWRWLPESLGSSYVWINVPAFTLAVMKDGKPAATEKAAVGKPASPTPMLSSTIGSIVFNPEASISPASEAALLAKLRDAGGLFGSSPAEILNQYHLKVKYNGKLVDPAKIDWKRTDAKTVSFVRGTGPSSVFGKLRFIFANDRNISLYEARDDSVAKKMRADGPASPRVDHPEKLAALLLTEDGNAAAQSVDKLLKDDDVTITLKQPVPLHIVYFTAVADENGKVETFPDVYKLDALTTAALERKAPARAARSVSAPERKPAATASAPANSQAAHAAAPKPKAAEADQAAKPKPKPSAVGQASERRGFGASAPD
jgi:murein L,D-transpeptidase YcbB/YkuD